MSRSPVPSPPPVLVRRLLVVFGVVALCSAGLSGGVANAQADGCPSGFAPVSFTPDDPAAVSPDLALFVACTDTVNGRGYFKNNADEVWVIDSPPGLFWEDAAPTASAAIFRGVLDLLERDNSIGVPAGLPIEPGTQAFFTLRPGNSMHVSVDPAVQALWHSEQAVSAKVVERGEDEAVKVMSGASKTRAAILTCGLAGYRAASTLQDVPSDSAGQLKSALDVGGDVKPCGKAVLAAQAEPEESVPAIGRVEHNAETAEPLIQRSHVLQVEESPSWLAKVERGLGTIVHDTHLQYHGRIP